MGAIHIVEAYCDGSICRSLLEDVHTARWSEYVGRVAIVILDLDIGVVAQFHDNLLLPNGHENSIYAEIRAIRLADTVCRENVSSGMFVIYSDNPDAVNKAGPPNARLISPGEFHPADEYLKKMLERTGYIRRTQGVGVRRRTPNSRQKEITKLMNASRVKFKLSESPLFRTFKLHRTPEKNLARGQKE